MEMQDEHQPLAQSIERKIRACGEVNDAWLADHLEACEVFQCQDVLKGMIACAGLIDRLEGLLLDEIAAAPVEYSEEITEPIRRLRMLFLEHCRKINARAVALAKDYRIDYLDEYRAVYQAAIAAEEDDFLPVAARRVESLTADICRKYGIEGD